MSIPQETRAELTHLRNKVADLEYMLKRKASMSDAEGLVRIAKRYSVPMGAARILAFMSSGKTYTREQIRAAYTNDDEASLRNVDSQIKRIRKSTDLKISSVYGYGYEMAALSAIDVRKVMRGL